MLTLMRKSAGRKQRIQALLEQLVARAREPVFFAGLGVPDTIDGRFDLVVLHGWLALDRLQRASDAAAAQGLTDALFVSFDEALREQGTGDMGMGRKMKAMADAFFGRLAAYAAADSQSAMAQALARNIWRGAPVSAATMRLAAYVETARTALGDGDVATDTLDFGPLP